MITIKPVNSGQFFCAVHHPMTTAGVVLKSTESAIRMMDDEKSKVAHYLEHANACHLNVTADSAIDSSAFRHLTRRTPTCCG